MTLKEAHEIQRKELMALRRENERLKEGTYTDAEKQEHEKIIRQLRREIQTLTKEKERYHQLWRDALARPDHRIEDLMKIEDLEKEVCVLKASNDQISKQLQEARDLIVKLKAQMNRDHENSSLPSSVKPFHKKIKNSRKKTERKPGAQKGHSGHRRPHMEPTVPVVELEAPHQSLRIQIFIPQANISQSRWQTLKFRYPLRNTVLRSIAAETPANVIMLLSRKASPMSLATGKNSKHWRFF